MVFSMIFAVINDKKKERIQKRPCHMQSKKPARNQLNFLSPTLKEQLNSKQELYLLSEQIKWTYFEDEFGPLYSDQGRPAHPIRLMVSLLILKALCNLSDEELVEQQWEMNPYFQYFGGIDILRWGQPCAATDLVHFRKRIGEEGKVLAQEKNSKNKIYSLHEPDVYCVAKGKAHKKYEYGCKGSVVLTQNTGIIVGAMTFEENVYDGHTLDVVLKQTQTLTGNYPKTATVDRGYKGTQKVESTSIIRPSKPLKRDNAYQKQKKRKHCRRRAAIEPIIGHIKKDHRVALNYLKGKAGDQVNFAMDKWVPEVLELRVWI